VLPDEAVACAAREPCGRPMACGLLRLERRAIIRWPSMSGGEFSGRGESPHRRWRESRAYCVRKGVYLCRPHVPKPASACFSRGRVSRFGAIPKPTV